MCVQIFRALERSPGGRRRSAVVRGRGGRWGPVEWPESPPGRLRAKPAGTRSRWASFLTSQNHQLLENETSNGREDIPNTCTWVAELIENRDL